MPKNDVSAIEKELSKVTKIVRKEGEPLDQAFLKKLQAKVDGLADDVWKKLSEPTQLWTVAASEALDQKEKIPSFDGTIETAAEEKEGEDGVEGKEEADGAVAKEEDEDAGKDKAGEKQESDVSAKKTAKKAGKAPAKAAKTAKTAKKKAGAKDGAKRGRKGEFDENSKITKVQAENPFREGSKAATCYKQYKVGRTVAAVLAAGVPRSKLARHAKKGVVTIG